MNAQAALMDRTVKPYKGPESYQVEDAGLFFGRDRETDQLIARILSSRFTLLYAQSGAGKTSLLNARIIPGLEMRGWGAYRILPQNDPVESVRTATLRYLLPHPEAERLAIERAWDALVQARENLTLDEILDCYDRLEIRDARRRALITPIILPAAQVVATGPNDLGPMTPYFCRLLRSSIEVKVFAEHILAVQQQNQAYASHHQVISGGTHMSELVGLLSDQHFLSSYSELLNELKVPGRDLSVFFQHVVGTYGRRCTHFALVLILDQFEELFTRFVDPGIAGPEFARELPDWRLRWEFFERLEGLYETAMVPAILSSPEVAANAEQPLPIRYVISIRDEYIAQLDPIRRFFWRGSEDSYHLNLLEKGQAEVAIREPANIFGYTYEPTCFERIIQQLTKENRFVEPAHLQLVCEKLWNEQGYELAGLSSENRLEEDMPSIHYEVFERLGETKGILKSFFQDFLMMLSDEERLEVLEMLEPLVTASGTRNILERDWLIQAPFRDSDRRRSLLSKLVDHTILRTEHRLGGYFVEITHEFLIDPILEAIRNAWSSNPNYSRYRSALSTLERLRERSIAGTNPPLSQQEFITLHQHRNAIQWASWGAELMLRAALAFNADSQVLGAWINSFQTSGEPPTLSRLFKPEEEAKRKEERELLTLGELRVINRDGRSSHEFSPAQFRLILRSELFWAIDEERKDVEFWTERMQGCVK
jgi:hypothetical protein